MWIQLFNHGTCLDLLNIIGRNETNGNSETSHFVAVSIVFLQCNLMGTF